MRIKALADPTGQELLFVASIRSFLAHAISHGFDTKAFRRLLKSTATPEAIQLWLEGQQVLAMAVNEVNLHAGLSPKDHKVAETARRTAENVLDRMRGKPTERVAVASRVRIEFGGIDPNLLPRAAQAEGGTVPPLPPLDTRRTLVQANPDGDSEENIRSDEE